MYEHECYTEECSNIINAHNFIIDSLYYVPICYQCNELVKKNGPRNIKTISNRYSLENSIGTQYDDNFTVEDHIPNTNELDNVSDTCSVSNDLKVCPKKKKKGLLRFLFFR